MKPVPSAVAALSAIASLAAQQWVRVDPAPSGLVSAMYDPTRQRALGVTHTPPGASTWSFDGTQWHRHSPDGFVVTNGLQYLDLVLAGYDTARGHGVAVQYRTMFGTDRTYVTSGAGWRLAANSNFGVFAPGVAFDPVNSELLAFGGTDGSYSTFFDSMRVWNGTQWSVRQAAVRPSPRRSAAMATDVARSRIVLFGGEDATGLLGDTWEWNGTQWTQFAPAVAPSTRSTDLEYDPAAQCVVALGGWTATSALLTDCWKWNGAQWTPHGTLPEQAGALGYHDGTSLFVVTGLEGANVWRRSGASWTPVWRHQGPSAYPAAIAFDPARTETLFVTNGGDTWAWNGSWRLRTSAGPAGRTGATFEPLGTDMIFFGGGGPPSPGWSFFDETWRWNGLTWTQLSPATLPIARFGHAMVNTGSSIVMFGGRCPTGLLADTWEFDGTNWAQRTPAQSPSPRLGHGFAYDPLRQRAVLFGGSPGNQPWLGDTWEWNGTNWIAHSPVGTPYAGTFQLVFDAAAGAVALPQWDYIWYWSGTDWTQGPPQYGIDLSSRLVFDSLRSRLLQCSWSGSVDVFTPTPAIEGETPQACGNRPDLRLFGRAALGTTPLVHTEGAANTLAIACYSLQVGTILWTGSCTQFIGPIGATLAGVLDGTGQVSMPFAIPMATALRGVQIHAQSIVLDGGPVFGGSLSGALHLLIGD